MTHSSYTKTGKTDFFALSAFFAEKAGEFSYKKIQSENGFSRIANMEAAVFCGNGDARCAAKAACGAGCKFDGIATSYVSCADSVCDGFISDLKSANEKTLFVAISLGEDSGALSALIGEVKQKGLRVAVIGDSSQYAQAADLYIDFPLTFDTIKDYGTAVCASYGLVLALSVSAGKVTADSADGFERESLECIALYDKKTMDALKNTAIDFSRKLACACEPIFALDVLSEGADEGASLIAQNIAARDYGYISMCENTEDWNHINIFERFSEGILTFFIGSTASPSFSRFLETLSIACQISRPAAVISDGEIENVEQDFASFILPERGAWPVLLFEPVPLIMVLDALCEGNGGDN